VLHDLLGALGWVSSAFGRAWLELAPYIGAACVGIWLDRRLSRSRKVSPVGYRNPLIRIDLADALGTDVTDADGKKIGREPAEEFDGLWLMLRNPKLQTQETLTPPDVSLGEDGQPSIADAMHGMRVVAARLIYDWNLPDPADPREDAPALPIQHEDDHAKRCPSVEDVAKVPGSVVVMIGERIRQAVAPR
jgi:hypothetical protein